ncbi:hypothetical protein A3A93_00720 [Candidatus Roizmanbacteria bacterium RIFCSPLOWO2_01_FULL_38_12]|uniref:Glycosyltransferase RgtA/B/C/D-like domain-containing protein n=1 Tax=Candidatus Roizmanbacteria bacterium RIFCSPLOWO2_01_FULL_38_12 TaxID=1802061 RepID=A0A1F7J086_9BACT|nr:MAG: hypothetical protein A3F59_01395 [Candidatus Roizmanbacteria bacterium RIFCSPHIGHO2_12_FULL_38_13]OGK49018.1 MAG: hypothetical protein A3A93_00720 [Candidatus Roizmanbacteria bacterium RIFCSPLOWO2_01_FULL_38_12]
MFRHVFDYIKSNTILLIILATAFLFHMFLIVQSGSNYCIGDECGLYFWGIHSHDSIWHIALATVSFKQYPFIVPTFAGGVLSGYNLLLDLVIYLFTFFGALPLFVFFKIIPILWIILFTVSAVILGRKIKDDVKFVAVFLIFVFFGGSYTYFLTLYHNGTIDGSASVLAMQSGLMMTNVQLALSFTVLLFMLYMIKNAKFDLWKVLLFCILTFITIGLKFYGGVIAVLLAVFYVLELYLSKKNFLLTFKYGLLIGLSIVGSVLIFYNPFAAIESGTVLIFSPFSIVHSIIEEPDLIYLKDLVLQRYYLQEVNPMSPRLLAIELFSATLFIFVNLGTRFFGLFYFLYKLIKRQITRFEVYIAASILLGTLLTIFFIQKGIWWNTVQFFYYVIFLANFFAAQMVYTFLKQRNRIISVIGIILILLALPINIDIIKGTIIAPKGYVSRSELEALEYLKSQPEGVVFSSFHYVDKKNARVFDDSSYIPALTGKQSYIDDLTQLALVGVDYSHRLERVQSLDCRIFHEVNFIYYKKYFSSEYLKKCSSALKEYKKTFENDKVTIFSNV